MEEKARHSYRWNAIHWCILSAVLAAGLSLRLYGLDRLSLWLDEMTSIEVARAPLERIISGTAFDNHTPPLYYVFLHLWGSFFGLDEFWLRLPSALIDGMNMALLSVLCNRFLKPGNTLLVVTGYAISPFMLYYSQEGRMYTMAVFFALAYSVSIERLVRSEKGVLPWAVASGVLLALGVYTHYYLVFYAFGVTCLALYRSRHSLKRVRGVFASGAIAALLFVPWVPVAARLAGADGQSFRKFVVAVVPYTYFRFTAGYAVFPINMHSKVDLMRSAMENAYYILAVFAALLIIAYGAVSSVTQGERRLFASAMVAAFVPALFGLIISLKAPMLSERYLIVTLPPFLILLLGFIDASRPMGKAAVAFLFFVMLAGDAAYFLNPDFGKAQWRDAARYVSERAAAGDVIIVEPGYTRSVFRHYFDRLNPGYDIIFADRKQPSLTEVSRRLREKGRVFLVTSGPNHGSGFAKDLAGFARVSSTMVFPIETGITCTVWETIGPDKPAQSINRPKAEFSAYRVPV